MSLLSFLALAAPKGLRRLIDEKIEQIVKESKAATDNQVTSETAAPDTTVTAPLAQQSPSAASWRLAYRMRPHQQMGSDDAELHHSHQVYQDHINSLADEHKLILALEIVEKKRELHQAELDQATIGPDTERQDQYRQRIARFNAELDELIAESKIKNHVTDEASGCQFAINLYRKGYNIGFQKHFLMTGKQ